MPANILNLSGYKVVQVEEATTTITSMSNSLSLPSPLKLNTPQQ